MKTEQTVQVPLLREMGREQDEGLYTGMFPEWGSVAGRAIAGSILEVEVTMKQEQTRLLHIPTAKHQWRLRRCCH